jgi:amidohydrolase
MEHAMASPDFMSALASEMTDWRRQIHSHPEIGYEEVHTSEFVAERLKSWGIEVHRGLGKTGLVGVLTGRPGNASIGLRADMDALEMEELNSFAHRSTIPRRFHGCGHDGHTAMLLGAASYLASTRNFAGTVYFIFQPAEEGLAGAKAMIDDGLFERFSCDAVYGIHNDPALDLGLVNVHAGTMLAASDHFKVTIRGKGCHGGQPHMGIDPIPVAAHVVTVLQTLVGRQTDPTDTAVISIGEIHGGTAPNVIPDSVEFRGTIRTLTEAMRSKVELLFRRGVENTAAAQGATAEIEYKRAYPATVNTAAEAELVGSVVIDLFGQSALLPNEPSWTASEDFSYMLQQRPGAYAFFGQRSTASKCSGEPLHNPSYDFNDALLPYGSGFFVRLVERALK